MRTLALFLACVLTLQASAEPERIAWSHSPEAFTGKVVVTRLTGGVTIEGSWISVTDDAFTVQVDNTSDRKAIGKGVQTLPRRSIEAISVRKHRIRGRVIGSLVGFYGVAGIAGAATHSPEALQGGWGLAAIAAGIVGFFVGRSWDRNTREVELLPH